MFNIKLCCEMMKFIMFSVNYMMNVLMFQII